jgi:hypothetical protein
LTRLRRSSPAALPVATAFVLAALAWPLRDAYAQGGLAKEGALFLLLPVGARSVGMGEAVVAGEPGSEGIWANPASLARLSMRELALNHSSSLTGKLDAFVFVLPEGRAGVFSAAAYYLDYGAQDNTDQFGNVIGSSGPKNLIFAASYGATFGSHVRAGLTAKFMQDRLDCSGDCTNVASHSVGGFAYDLGVQVSADSAGRLNLGAAVRNLGQPLQINDVAQADPLPSRVHLGAQYLLPSVERAVKGAELRVSAEVLSTLGLDQASWRAGGEFAYLKQFFLRAGFQYGNGNDPTGASIGVGYQSRTLSIDFARITGGISADQGQPPTYVTIRFRF